MGCRIWSPARRAGRPLPPVLLFFLALVHAAPGAAAEPPGIVDFPTSCDPSVAARFNDAVTMLHSFEYTVAAERFRAVAEADPDCGMARWGEAMTLWHPLWAPPSVHDLETGARLLAAIDDTALAPREAAYVHALRGFFDDHESAPHQIRAERYAERMEHVYQAHRDDPEAALFRALALLAIADPADKTYCRQYQAAALLHWVGATRPDHPGVLHYLIHSFDYPGLAHLALDAAERYAESAPESAHAQHMPSHIFTRLGMWERAIGSNHHATAAAADYTARAGLPGHYDEGLHSIDYLMYALLQTGRDAEAKRLLETLETLGKAYPETFKVAYTYAATPARYALERRAWREASRLPLLAPDFPWQSYGWARSIHHFARGLGAARSGRIHVARRELASIREIAASLPDDTLPYWREQVLVHADAVAAWIALSEGESERALRLAQAAADREDAVDKHPVTPGEVIPARELFGDMLLQLDRPDDALREYRRVLEVAPGRTNALLGAARASTRAGDAAAAAGYYRQIVGQTVQDNLERAGLREARAYRPG